MAVKDGSDQSATGTVNQSTAQHTSTASVCSRAQRVTRSRSGRGDVVGRSINAVDPPYARPRTPV